MHYALFLESDSPTGRREVLLRVAGDADLAEMAALESFVLSLPDGADLHLDLAGLEFAGAAFVNFLVAMDFRTSRSGARLTLGAPPPRLRALLDRLGLSSRLRLAPAGPRLFSRRPTRDPA